MGEMLLLQPHFQPTTKGWGKEGVHGGALVTLFPQRFAELCHPQPPARAPPSFLLEQHEGERNHGRWQQAAKEFSSPAWLLPQLGRQGRPVRSQDPSVAQ